MENKLKRIIMDLEDFSDLRYLNGSAEHEIKEIIKQLKKVRVYSTEL